MKTQPTFALALLSALGTTPLLAELTISPAPPGYPTSTNCEVRVNGRSCPVFDTRVFFELNHPDRVVSWSQFDFTGKARVEVIVPRKVESVRIRPVSAGIGGLLEREADVVKEPLGFNVYREIILVGQPATVAKP